jgi:hypothetical protein
MLLDRIGIDGGAGIARPSEPEPAMFLEGRLERDR